MLLMWLQPDVQGTVHGRFHDSAISVREASIDLVGRFLTVQRGLTAQYYPMLAERILVSRNRCVLFASSFGPMQKLFVCDRCLCLVVRSSADVISRFCCVDGKIWLLMQPWLPAYELAWI